MTYNQAVTKISVREKYWILRHESGIVRAYCQIEAVIRKKEEIRRWGKKLVSAFEIVDIVI